MWVSVIPNLFLTFSFVMINVEIPKFVFFVPFVFRLDRVSIDFFFPLHHLFYSSLLVSELLDTVYWQNTTAALIFVEWMGPTNIRYPLAWMFVILVRGGGTIGDTSQ